MLACPESPTWLALKGRRREAAEVGEKLWGADAAAAQLGAGGWGCPVVALRVWALLQLAGTLPREA